MVVTTDLKGVQIKRYSGKVLIHKIPNTLRGDLVLPQPITHIQKTSFVGCDHITSITIQEHVRAINAGAFDHCVNLEKFDVSRDNKHFESDYKGSLYTKGQEWLICVPQKQSGIYVVSNRVKHIEKGAFKNCADITTLMLGQTVTSIGSGAFENCTGLLHMIIPPNVTKIEPGAFAGCTQLCGVTVSADNLYFSCEDGALFSKDKTTLIYVPATLQGQRNKKDGRYQVPDSVTNIAPQAFSGCAGIKEIVLPDSLKTIGKNAFEGCSGLTSVYAPAGVVKWDEVFSQCENLKNRYIRDPQGIIYNRDTRKIVHVWNKIECAYILNGVESIEANTFANCPQLTTVGIPKTVTDISSSAFKGCKNLTTIVVSAENEGLYTDESGVLYRKVRDNVALLRAPTNLSATYCVPKGVTHIAQNAFESCLQLKKLVIPESVWAIQRGAFVDCPNLSICGKPGSDAEEAARTHKIPFIAL